MNFLCDLLTFTVFCTDFLTFVEEIFSSNIVPFVRIIFDILVFFYELLRFFHISKMNVVSVIFRVFFMFRDTYFLSRQIYNIMLSIAIKSVFNHIDLIFYIKHRNFYIIYHALLYTYYHMNNCGCVMSIRP